MRPYILKHQDLFGAPEVQGDEQLQRLFLSEFIDPIVASLRAR
jgi:hypothetical protein